jgi:tetratricopeptide (TPR) repeat protein
MGGLDEAITQVVAGKFDVAAAQKEFSEREVSQKRMMELNTLFGAYLQQSDKGEKEKAAETGAKLLEIASKDQMILNAIAWNVLTNPRLKNRDLAFALKASEAAVAVSGGKDGAILDTYARALFDNGKVTEAVATQKKAVGLVTDKTQKAELEKTLQKYESAPAK